MKMTIEVVSEDKHGILMAYEAILPLALRWSHNSMIKILVPKQDKITEDSLNNS